jgi:hypothetical protein
MKQKTLLKNWYESLPNGRTKSIKAEIIQKCQINETKLSNWMRGKTNVPALAKPILNKIAIRESGKPIYDETTPTLQN